MSNNININAIFNLMHQEMKELNKKNKSSQSSSNNNNELNRAAVKEFEMKVGLDQTYGPPTVEDYKVVQFVTYVYYTMYPTKDGDVYPSHWKEGVVYGYQQIRKERAKIRGSEMKDGMKGMRLQIVVACLLYCTLIQEQESLMPVPIFLKYINSALKRYVTKNDQKPIDMKTFERYRTESKPKGVGIKPYLKKRLPRCYHDIEPEDMIQFTGFSLLSLRRPEVFRARRIAQYGKKGFSDTEPPSYIALGALYIVAIQNGVAISHNDFGITEYKLKQSVNTILKESENQKRLSDDLQGFTLPQSISKKRKSASVK